MEQYSEEYNHIRSSKDSNVVSKLIAVTDIEKRRIRPFISEAMVYTQLESDRLVRANSIKLEAEDIGEVKAEINLPKAECTLKQMFPLDKKQRKSFLIDIITGIYYLHCRRLIHGDIKSSNVLIYTKEDENGQKTKVAKLNDFGTVTLIPFGNSNTFDPLVKMYTPTHCPPEILLTDTWGFAADIWALGCTIYEMTYGTNLFKELDDIVDWCENYTTVTPKSLGDQIKINKLIIMLLHPEPDKRLTIFDLYEKDFSNLPVKVEPCTCCINFYSNSRSKPFKITKYQKRKHIDELIVHLYESLEHKVLYFKNLYRIVYIVIHLLVYRKEPPDIREITRHDIEDIITLCKETNFKIVDFNRFYGILN